MCLDPNLDKGKMLLATAIGFAAHKHMNQVRKYTNTPYIFHPLAVAELLSRYGFDEEVLAAAVLHDVLEDTATYVYELEFNFSGTMIANIVKELTDVSTKQDGNRENRKRKDLEHFKKATPVAQNIKMADIIHNVNDIVEHDLGFAKTYIVEKEAMFKTIDKAKVNAELYELTEKTLSEAKIKAGI